ncbi:MAG: hypothetical protein QM778_22320 [Myxococcales bacterium]
MGEFWFSGHGVVGLSLVSTLLLFGHGSASAQLGPLALQNPGTAPAGAATQHGDSAASDTTPRPGPGARVSVSNISLLAVCPSVLIGADGVPLAVCTQILDQAPAVYLLDPNSGLPLAYHALTKSGLFGGVYPYLDDQGNVVVVDGDQHLLRIRHKRNVLGLWSLDVVQDIALDGAVGDDAVVGVAPDYARNVWFATDHGTVGVISGSTGSIATVALPEGERVFNSIATSPSRTAVVTDHALYLFHVDENGAPQIALRAPYDRGNARKPGKLSQGSGSTPTFFGPRTGSEYVALVDNAEPFEHLLVYPTSGSGDPICNLTLPTPTGKGSENSPIGSGNSVFVASTYGYPYPAYPAGVSESVPASAPIGGGITRVDLDSSSQGCRVVWTNSVHSASVPKLSLADRTIYTFERTSSFGSASALDGYVYKAIDAVSGRTLASQALGIGVDTLQMAGNIGSGRVLYQGIFGGVLRIAPSP